MFEQIVLYGLLFLGVAIGWETATNVVGGHMSGVQAFPIFLALAVVFALIGLWRGNAVGRLMQMYSLAAVLFGAWSSGTGYFLATGIGVLAASFMGGYGSPFGRMALGGLAGIGVAMGVQYAAPDLAARTSGWVLGLTLVIGAVALVGGLVAAFSTRRGGRGRGLWFLIAAGGAAAAVAVVMAMMGPAPAVKPVAAVSGAPSASIYRAPSASGGPTTAGVAPAARSIARLPDGSIDLDAVDPPAVRAAPSPTSGPIAIWSRWADIVPTAAGVSQIAWVALGILVALLLLAFLFLKALASLAPVMSRPLLRGPIAWLEARATDNTSPWLWLADMIQFNRVMTRNIPSRSGAHGSARLLNDTEILANWGAEGGFVLGELRPERGDRRVLSYSGNGSILIEAAPEQGKTSGSIIPTLLSPNPESRVVLDVKGELIWATGNYRRSLGQRVLVMDPHRVTPEGHAGEDARINLLIEFLPAGGEQLTDRAIELCDLLMPPSEGDGGNNEYFKDNGRSLLFGLLIWVRCAPQELLGDVPRSLYGVKMLLDSSEGLQAYIKGILPQLDGLQRHARDLVKLSLGKFLPLAEATFSSAATQAGNPLGFLLSHGWRRSLCGEPGDDGSLGVSFRLADFLAPGSDLYLAISPAQLKAHKGLAPRLLVGCLANRLLLEAGRGLPSKVRFVLDEVAQMGRIPALVTLVEVGRPVATVCFVIQFYGQLVSAYGKDSAETLLNMFQTRLYLSVRGEETAKRISAAAGKMTVVDRSTSNRDGNSSKERGEDVLSVSAIMTMETSKSIVSGPTPRRGEHSYTAIIDRFTWTAHPHYRALGNLEPMPELPALDAEFENVEGSTLPEQAAAE